MRIKKAGAGYGKNEASIIEVEFNPYKSMR
jgi:hypothetical protein